MPLRFLDRRGVSREALSRVLIRVGGNSLTMSMHDATVVYNKSIVPGIFRLRLACPDMAQQARPGQFVMMQVSAHTDPLLRRPFSLCSAREDSGDILYKVVGRGTAAVAAWKPGQRVSCIGPLGNGFTLTETPQRAYLVAGGMGIAPLLFLLEALEQQHKGALSSLWIGGKTGNDVAVFEDFKPLLSPIYYATEDGSQGFRGLVTDFFSSHLKAAGSHAQQRAHIYGCGPAPMARVLSEIAEHHAMECQLSLESRMACGIGSCLGCAVKARVLADNAVSSDTGRDAQPCFYKRICADGPVFNSKELVWDAGKG